jgi:glycosyl transferase family 25
MTDPSVATFKILVISMDGAVERQRAFAERAKDAGVEWRFAPAYTSLHPALQYVEEDAIIGWGRPLRRGELGCYSSHYAAWEQLLADDVDQYVVLEDDVIVDWTFLRMLAPAKIGKWKIDYLRLYYKTPCKYSVLKHKFIEEAHTLIELKGMALGTQGYVITKAGARGFMDGCKKVVRPIDVAMDRVWAHGVKNRAVFPFPIMEEAVSSGIGPSRYEPFIAPSHLRLKRRVARARERLWSRVGVAAATLRSKWLRSRLGAVLGARQPDYR